MSLYKAIKKEIWNMNIPLTGMNYLALRTLEDALKRENINMIIHTYDWLFENNSLPINHYLKELFAKL